MRISDIDNAINECQTHLAKTNSFGTKIENYLVSYLLILIINCFERKFNEISKRNMRCTNCKKNENNYFNSTVDKLLKRYKTSDLGDFIKFFGDHHRRKFDKMRKNQKIKRIFQIYNNLQENRQLVAHSQGINMTFVELVTSYDECHSILNLFEYLIKYDPQCFEELRKRTREDYQEISPQYKTLIIQSYFQSFI